MVPRYSELVGPLELLRNESKIVWNNDYQAIYETLKDILSSDFVLSYPDFSLPFEVATDASQYGIAAVLYQTINGTRHYVCFASRALTGGESNYSATKRELLGVVFALKKFRYYLYGAPFTLYTDHKALIYIHTQKTPNPLIQGWIDTLLELDYTIVHRPGLRNVLPDRLSRVYDLDNQTIRKDLEFSALEVTIPSIETNHIDDINLSAAEKSKLLTEQHLRGHFGSLALAKGLLSRGISWLGMRKEAEALVKECVACQRFNIAKQGFHPLTPVDAALPMDHIAIDLKSYPKSRDGNVYCLVVIDICTRFVWLRPIPNKKEGTIAQALFRLFTTLGSARSFRVITGRSSLTRSSKRLFELPKLTTG